MGELRRQARLVIENEAWFAYPWVVDWPDRGELPRAQKDEEAGHRRTAQRADGDRGRCVVRGGLFRHRVDHDRGTNHHGIDDDPGHHHDPGSPANGPTGDDDNNNTGSRGIDHMG